MILHTTAHVEFNAQRKQLFFAVAWLTYGWVIRAAKAMKQRGLTTVVHFAEVLTTWKFSFYQSFL